LILNIEPHGNVECSLERDYLVYSFEVDNKKWQINVESINNATSAIGQEAKLHHAVVAGTD